MRKALQRSPQAGLPKKAWHGMGINELSVSVYGLHARKSPVNCSMTYMCIFSAKASATNTSVALRVLRRQTKIPTQEL